MLEGVVTEGSGKQYVHNPLYKIAGKTGTAQVADANKGYRAKKQYPNVPSALPLVAETVAVILEMSVAQVAQLTVKNARRFLML